MADTEIKTDAEKALASIKAETAKLETEAKADAAKVVNVWHSHEIYFVAFVCLVVGALIGYALK